MLHAKPWAAALFAACTVWFPALAQSGQGMTVIGAWSGERPVQGGMDRSTVSFGQDGSYVSVERLPNGTMQRAWGVYSATPLSAWQMTVALHRQGWLPHQICAQAPGFPVKCNAYTPPAAASLTLSFTSSSSFEVNGMMLTRDAAAHLLQQQVADRVLLPVAAPVQPHIAQPVMPPSVRYQPLHNTGGPGCDDMQQNRICTVNEGHIVIENGCQVCVSP